MPERGRQRDTECDDRPLSREWISKHFEMQCTWNKRSNVLCILFGRTQKLWLYSPGGAKEAPRRMPAHSCHSHWVPLYVSNWLITVEMVRINANLGLMHEIIAICASSHCHPPPQSHIQTAQICMHFYTKVLTQKHNSSVMDDYTMTAFISNLLRKTHIQQQHKIQQ